MGFNQCLKISEVPTDLTPKKKNKITFQYIITTSFLCNRWVLIISQFIEFMLIHCKILNKNASETTLEPKTFILTFPLVLVCPSSSSCSHLVEHWSPWGQGDSRGETEGGLLPVLHPSSIVLLLPGVLVITGQHDRAVSLCEN